FPDHFFQHWSGYNVMAPLHDPVPVMALVPQFYGYYQPEDPLPDYLSPILLLEHCGVPIDVDTLCADDRNECASLLLRFHHEGWLHNSFAERNILVQAGPITDWPLGRMFSDKYSFRLIDFGRSAKYERSLDRAAEESEMARLLKLMHFAET
ncbi:hypothetical protein CONPUDRAFT_44143, partial [Coniophora puteana RWD-64-598 SS2]